MEEFIGNIPIVQLTCLLLFPITSIILIVMGLIFTRGGSSFPYQFTPPKPKKETPPMEDDEDEEDDTVEALDISVLSTVRSQPPPPVKAVPEPVVVEPIPSPPPPSIKQPPQELLRLLHDPESGKLMVQIGDTSFRQLTDIPNKQTGQYLLELTAHLLRFTNGMYTTTQGVSSVRPPKVGPLPTNVPIKKQPPPPPPSPLLPPVILPSNKPIMVGSLPPPDALLSGFSLADEINEFVQKRLAYSPLAQTTTITITTALNGGIEIKVNGHSYHSADEVADPEARQLIQLAIKDWEKS